MARMPNHRPAAGTPFIGAHRITWWATNFRRWFGFKRDLNKNLFDWVRFIAWTMSSHFFLSVMTHQKAKHVSNACLQAVERYFDKGSLIIISLFLRDQVPLGISAQISRQSRRNSSSINFDFCCLGTHRSIISTSRGFTNTFNTTHLLLATCQLITRRLTKARWTRIYLWASCQSSACWGWQKVDECGSFCQFPDDWGGQQ